MTEPQTPDVFLSGLLFLDLVFTGLDSPPAAGTEVWTRGMGSGPGGIANFAVALRRLGLATSLATAFGDDIPGELCRAAARGRGRRPLPVPPVRRLVARRSPWRCAYDDDRALVTYGEPPPLSRGRAGRRAAAEPRRPRPHRPGAGGWLAARRPRKPGLRRRRLGPLAARGLPSCSSSSPPATRSCRTPTRRWRYTRTDTPAAALSRLADLVPLAVVTLGRDGAIAVDGTTGESASVAGPGGGRRRRDRRRGRLRRGTSSPPPSPAGRWPSGCGSPYCRRAVAPTPRWWFGRARVAGDRRLVADRAGRRCRAPP